LKQHKPNEGEISNQLINTLGMADPYIHYQESLTAGIADSKRDRAEFISLVSKMAILGLAVITGRKDGNVHRNPGDLICMKAKYEAISTPLKSQKTILNAYWKCIAN
jgi:hypothetical protein